MLLIEEEKVVYSTLISYPNSIGLAITYYKLREAKFIYFSPLNTKYSAS